MKTNDKIKYTTDGRKVVVIGDLNQSEKIVQEIFVTEDGAEIPSGERFVVKSLLDAPAKSWKEKELEKLEATYRTEKDEWERKINRVMEEKKLVYESLLVRVKWLKQVAKQPHPDALKNVVETLALFLSNTDKWVFYADYDKWHLEKFDEEGVSRIHDSLSSDYGRVKYNEMRLVSIFGKSNGDFEFRKSTYSDGSGSDNTVEYFQSKEDALKYIQNRFNAIKKYAYYHLNIAAKFNLELDKEKLEKYKSERRINLSNDIDNLKKKLSETEELLNQI